MHCVIMIYCQFNALTYAVRNWSITCENVDVFFPKSVSDVGTAADPAEQVGAKNSISPKNDLRSFCTNVTICKI